MRSNLCTTAPRSVLAAVLFLSPAILIALAVSTAMAQGNPVVVENQQPGTTGWQISDKVSSDKTGQIKGYASSPSVNKGETINFYVSTNPPQTYTMDVYRLGWYQGLGGRLMQHVGPLNGLTQPTCPRDATTGMIECNWAPTYTLQTQSSWTSGVYVVLMTNAQGFQNYMIFVVRDDNRVAALLYNEPVMTQQAYNGYPDDNATGKSLYEYNSFGPSVPATGTTRAAKVSFDRPYADLGAGDFLGGTGEINFVRWIEKSGYDITYATDLDTHTDGYRLLNYRGFLAVGHDEYWSKQMYDAAVAARDAGVNLGFFGADPVYWQIRLEDSSSGVPHRVIACYKDEARDPNPDPTLKTVLWRDPPLNRPEQQLVGVQYTSMPPYNNNFYAPYVVTNSSNWVYAGTGFQDGNSAPALVGYEADRLFSEYPGPNAVPGTYTLLSHSPYQSVQGPDYGNSSIYQAPSGAWVFSSGSMNWNWGLDSYADGIDHGWFPAGVVDTRIQKATANILDRFIIGVQPDFSVTASPSSFTLAPGASTGYNVTISPLNSFTGAVTLSVSGLPTGATGNFTPNPATGSSTLTVTTSASTPVGTYPLVITGVSGSLTHTTSVSLTVSVPDFSLSATPPTQTILVGGTGNYSLAIAPISGFTSAVTLSVIGLPTGATGSFAPNPATGSSTLTVTTTASTPVGTYPLTITGVSGALTHTATVSVTVSTTLPPPGVFLDAVGPSSGGASVTSGSSLTWNHTVTPTGSNLLLIAAVSVGVSPDTNRTLAVTYNGVAMTPVGLVHSNNSTLGYTQMFALKAPATGTHAVVVTLTGGNASLAGGSASFTGVDQTNPIRNVATKSGTGVSPNVTVTSSQGDIVVDAMVTGCDGTITSSKTLLWLKQVNCSTAGGIGAQSMTAGAPSVTMGYTVPSDWWGMIGVDVVGAPAPPPTDFSLSTEGDKSVTQGSAVTNAVTASLSSGIAQNVTFSAAGLPTGVTASFNPGNCVPTCGTTLTLTAIASATVGAFPITLTGTAGSVSRTSTFTLNVTAPIVPDFSLSANPSSQTVSAGGAASYSVNIARVNGFSGTVTFSVSGLPSGATGTFTPDLETGSSTLTVTSGASTPAGTYPLTITGVTGSLTHTTAVSLTVNVPDFSLSATPPSQTVDQGASGNYSVTINPTNGFASGVTLSISGLPTGASSSFTPNPATGSSTLTVSTGASTPAGTYPLTITGVSGSLTHTAAVSLTVNVPDFSLGAAPPSQTVAQGASGNYSVTINPTNGFASGVTLSISGLPTGATGSFTPNPATGSSTLTVSTGVSTPAGTYPLTITGVSGSLTHTAAISITVTVPDFSLSATPPSQTIVQGAPGNYSVTINPTNGFSSAVALSISGLPTGATGSFAPNPATGSATLSVATTASTPGGTYPLTITGVGGSLTHTAAISITVNVPDFSLGATPSSQTVVQGASANYSVTITPTNGFSSGVTFSLTGLPTGATGAFTPNPATGSATLSVATTASTPGGTYPLTITGVSGSLTHTATISITVNVPDFSLGATPPSQTVVQGGSANYGVTITPINSFTSAVTFSVSGLPTGATGTFTPNPATGSSTLAVTTTAGTPVGTYPLTITGVSGSLTHTATVSLSVTTTLPPQGVAFDAVGPSSAGTGAASVAAGGTLSWSHTVTASGSNLLLMVAVTVGSNPDTNRTLTVTYNGVAMTPAGLVHSNNKALGYVQMFYLTAPAPGTHTVQVTLTGGKASLAAGSVSFTGVDQTTPLRNIATGFGTGVSPRVTVASASGNMVIDAMVTGCDGTITSSQTLRWLKQVNCSTAGGIGAQSTAAGASSITMGYTVPSDWWGMIGADIVAAH
jgi:uncharacterized membrane protein